ncbi:hypothetical protein TNCT_167881 [Trichonephila clavata]|uniref:Uncharacterized protein n=1 Tax=Trichonephila clavata TaxID=2740835 RepID=A0A8X6F5H8_TRICU|nr:hypothetical protein TNCT_167881 [Trichonephila clavata]
MSSKFLPSWRHPCGDIKPMARKTWHITLSQRVLRERHTKHMMIDAFLTLDCTATKRYCGRRNDVEYSQMREREDKKCVIPFHLKNVASLISFILK